MLGAFAVGKTSLIKRFVHSTFSERYQTTIGVKIDKKQVRVDGDELTLILWDLHGEDEFQSIRSSYLRGSAGFLIVVDGTRPETLELATGLQALALEAVGEVPVAVLLNKADLKESWELPDAALAELRRQGLPLFETSAKTGAGVEEAFEELARRLLRGT